MSTMNSSDNISDVEPGFEFEIGGRDWQDEAVLGILDHDPGAPDMLVVSPYIKDREVYSQISLKLLELHFRLQCSPAEVRAEQQRIYVVFSGFEAPVRMDIAAMGIKAEIVSLL
jgi:hypothetical protein